MGLQHEAQQTRAASIFEDFPVGQGAHRTSDGLGHALGPVHLGGI